MTSGVSDNTGHSFDTVAISGPIIKQVAMGLEAIGSSLVVNGRLDEGVRTTVTAVIEETLQRLDNPADTHSDISVLYAVTPDFASIAREHAVAEHHPAEPLMAAEVIFGVALPELAQLKVAHDTVRLAATLHNAIWRRFPPGAIAYVEFILAKLARAHLEERLALSRELHDRVAHQIAIGLQRTELAGDAATDDERLHHLTEARLALAATLVDVQDISVALRLSVGDRSLFAAISEFAERLPAVPRIHLTTTGEASRLLFSISEEVFAIVLEALRNARRHAGSASAVDVAVRWTPTDLTIEISDDGSGFQPDRTPERSHGIRSMRERAQILGAQLEISSGETGTRVQLKLPLGRATESE